MKYKAVFFDMDGTLIDSFDFHFEIVKQIMNHYKVNIEPSELKLLMGVSFQYILNKTLDETLHEEASSIFNSYFNNDSLDNISKIKIIDNVYDICEKFKKNDLYSFLVTNSPTLLVQKIIEINNLNFFSGVYPGKDKDVSKVERCKKIFNEYNLQPSDVLYVGDTSYDIKLAEELSIDSCLIVNSFSWIQYEPLYLRENIKPTYVIDDIKDIILYI